MTWEELTGILPYFLALALIPVGLYAIVAKKNLVKVIVGVATLEYGVNLFLVLLAYRWGGIAPIFTPGDDKEWFARKAVDPLPQAMILTSIVIGLAVIALLISVSLRLYQKYGTFDVTEMNELKG
jgi:multicomponent Na+:H+ antiporter subunit C